MAHRAIKTEFHEILRANVHLRQARRRHQHGVIADANGDIPVLPRNEAALVQAAADSAHRQPEFVSPVRGGYPIR